MKVKIESMGLAARGERGEDSMELAIAAGKACLERSVYSSADIDLVINTCIFQDDHCLEPASAVFMQKELGINDSVERPRSLSFDLSNGRAGMLNAINVARSFISNGMIKSAMLITNSRSFNSEGDRGDIVSALALIIDGSGQGEAYFGGTHLKTFTAYSDRLTTELDASEKGARLRHKRDEGIEEIFVKCAAEVCAELLAKEGLDISEIDYIVAPQLSEDFFACLAPQLAVDRAKIVTHGELPEGNDFSTFIPFYFSLENNHFPANSRVLLLTLGSGITAGAALYNL